MSKIAYLIAKEDWKALAKLKAVDELIEAIENLIEFDQLWEAEPEQIFSALILSADKKDLKDTSSKVMKFIKKCLTNNSDTVRVLASGALCNYDKPFKFPMDILLYAISDESDEVRRNIGESIAYHREEAVEPLVNMLKKGIVWHGFREDFNKEYHKNENDLDVWQDIRTSIIESLGSTKSSDAVNILIKILNEKQGFNVYDAKGKKIGFHKGNWDCKKAAAEALGYIGDVKAIEPLNKAIKSEDFFGESTLTAALSLAQLNEANGIEIIITEYKSEKRSLTEGWNHLKRLPAKKVGTALEKLELYEDAEEWYTSAGMLDKAAEMRRKMAEMAGAKTVVHGDYVDDRDTIVKDSVLNRSSVVGGSSKMQELRELAEMKKEGLINDEEYEKMKKEIIG